MSLEELKPGTRIRNYILEAQLGTGTVGEVWKASDGVKNVSLKLIHPQLLASRNATKHLTLMQREIEALGRLQSHPNIPRIFDYDLYYERPYLAMQYIGGASYEKLIKSGDMLRIPLSTRLSMIRGLAMALAAAHHENIIHRNIKPANASGTENPYLLDFSLALLEEELQNTQANIGTKLYMPWDAIPDKLGDIYSFGLLAYEIIFGRHAIFRPEDNAMLRATPFMPLVVAGERVKNREWNRPSKLSLDEVPVDLLVKDLHRLDDVFQKVLGHRTQRYEDPRAFVDDLVLALEAGAPLEDADLRVVPAPMQAPVAERRGVSVFVSYSSKDKSECAELVEQLGSLKTTTSVWYDNALKGQGGQEWWQKILDQVRNRDVFIFVLTPKSLLSFACYLEYTYADALNKWILPVKSQPFEIPLLPPALKRTQIVDFTGDDRLAQLTKSIDDIVHLGAKSPPSSPPKMPPVPFDDFTQVATKLLDATVSLSHYDQQAIFGMLEDMLQSERTLEGAQILLYIMKSRRDTLLTVGDKIRALQDNMNRTSIVKWLMDRRRR